MRKNKKGIILPLLLLCLAFFAGWGEKAAELLDDRKLIDLGKAIKEMPIGKENDNTQTSENQQTGKEPGSEEQAAGESAAASGAESMEPQEEEIYVYIISIKDTTITYDNGACDITALKSEIISDCGNGAGTVYLVDDYAEAHLYKEVLAMLAQLHETIELEYDFD